MREIKFRAWDGKKMHFDIARLHFNEGGLPYGILTWEDVMLLKFDLMQSTGLSDKKEKEIYEGDILGDTYMLIVHWCEKCGGFQMRNEEYGCFACEGDLHWAEVIADKNREVIGNIYEHAELLQ